MKIAIIVSQFNKDISDGLLNGAKKGLKDFGVKENEFEVYEVPGAFEIPLTAQKLADTKKIDGIIALGCVLKGDTYHYEAVCQGTTYGIQKVSIENKLPIMFGVLMCETNKQAIDRSSANEENKGWECAKSLIEMFELSKKMV
ncbi:MAG: 6,7-dimethyl-8-ribityllumazine synthase [Candidatus Gracilibacteria bacterium]